MRARGRGWRRPPRRSPASAPTGSTTTTTAGSTCSSPTAPSTSSRRSAGSRRRSGCGISCSTTSAGRRFEETSARRGPGVRARGDQPRRGVRRHRQRRRRRHRRHQQQRAGAAAAQPGRRAEPLAAGAPRPAARATGSGSARWIGVERAGTPTLWRRVRTDGSYLSASDAARALRPRAHRPRRRRRRALAGRPERAVDRHRGRPGGDLAPRSAEVRESQ